MKIANVPSKFAIPFAASAGGGYIRSIPQASQIGITNGAASLTDGFPPLNFLPVGSGGVPPFGQDMNGILNQITLWSQWQGAGGLVVYDSALSTAIGGYPEGAILASTTAGLIWLNTVDDNTANPDTTGTGWVGIPNIPNAQAGKYNFAVAGGTANALTATLAPVPASLTVGMTVNVQIASANTITNPTLNVNGLSPGATIVGNDGSALPLNSLVPNLIGSFAWDGANWRLESYTALQSPPRNIQTYSTPGTTNFTVPAGVYKLFAQCWGGGGGGGGTTGPANAGGGGGGGGYTQGWFDVTPGQVIAITVGAGGVAGSGAGTGTGGTGGTSSAGSLCSCTGGAGGANSSATGGTGGNPTGGSFQRTGGNGYAGGYYLGNTSFAFGGAGAPAYQQSIILPAFQGGAVSGFGFGSGGSGASSTGAASSGGPGAAGAVILQY